MGAIGIGRLVGREIGGVLDAGGETARHRDAGHAGGLEREFVEVLALRRIAAEIGEAVGELDVVGLRLHHVGGEELQLLATSIAAICADEPALTAVRAANVPMPNAMVEVSPVTTVMSS